jgi:hypothetical protein
LKFENLGVVAIKWNVSDVRETAIRLRNRINLRASKRENLYDGEE